MKEKVKRSLSDFANSNFAKCSAGYILPKVVVAGAVAILFGLTAAVKAEEAPIRTDAPTISVQPK